MSKKSHPNPHYRDAWTQEAQNEFLKNAFEYYCRERGNPLPQSRPWWSEWYERELRGPNAKPYHAILSYLYKYGQDYNLIRMSYGEFVHAVMTQSYPGSPRQYYSRRHRRWADENQPYTFYWKAEYRHKLKYQKKEHHAPKEISEKEQSRQDWRRKKGFDKHRANPYWSTGKKWAKECSNSKHRAWERNNIKAQNWEVFDDWGDEAITWFFDPWMWD